MITENIRKCAYFKIIKTKLTFAMVDHAIHSAYRFHFDIKDIQIMFAFKTIQIT